jgi:hypothetical protein
MPAPSLTNSGINVLISFVQANANGASILKYKVEILSTNGQYYESLTYCDGSTLAVLTSAFCSIPMSALTTVPYSYTLGSLIQGRVSA